MAYAIRRLILKRLMLIICLCFPKKNDKEKVMEKKKLFVEPEVEVVRFDEKDVITASPTAMTTSGSYAIESIKNFFNIGV